MTKMKNLMLSLLIAAPMTASAAGMGIYVPFNVTETETIDYSDTYYGYSSDTIEYKSAPGFGIAFDSNIGKDKIYNYRLGLEYHSVVRDTINGHSANDSYTKNKFNIVNTFGFGVFRNKAVRLWVGPRLNIQFQDWDTGSSSVSRGDFGVGLAAAAGVNVNLGKVVSLALDLDYHAVALAGSTKYTNNSGYGDYTVNDSYTGTNEGVTARFYLLFRFGEKFQNQAAQPIDQGVIDQSL